jgi:stage II sporulation protein AA (anti-sigma F factor antagonist)
MADPVDDCESTLTVMNARNEFARASAWLDDFAAGAGLSKDLTARLHVVLDEILNNIMSHALADAPNGQREIWLCLRIRADLVELEVSDDGPEFDPTSVVPVAKATRVAERQEGGVGLLFVRALMDEVRFKRQSGRNCLTLCKRLAVPVRAGDCPMEILESRTDNAVVVHIAGSVNSGNASELAERLKLLINTGCRAMVVDLARLDYMTSAGLRCLLRIDRQAQEVAGKVVLCGLHGLTLELFEVGGFLDMFMVARSREEAVRQAAAI